MTLSSTTPQRLYLMQLGTSIIPTTPQPTAGSAGCYLVQTSDGKNILIDSGLPADYTPPPGTPPAENEKNVLEHIADLGQSRLLRQSTSAVLPLPTGPAIPTLNALANVFSVIHCSFLPKTKNTAGPEVRLWLARR